VNLDFDFDFDFDFRFDFDFDFHSCASSIAFGISPEGKQDSSWFVVENESINTTRTSR
jgi:hypothetical protein